ncbi:MAG TPA: iron-containing alcohol dehydrogenase [Gaiellaceae bacterium]|nr:iron-containing alcohol dehydrogenase [Gaiellaceae bacterium]
MTKPVFRFGAGSLTELADVLREVGSTTPLLVTTSRAASLADRSTVAAVYDGVRSHAPVETVEEACAAAVAAGADAVVALGGGSAVDTAKAVSARLAIPVVAVPTTYAGAEFTSYFGMRDEAARRKAGGTGATTVAAIYDPDLTVDLPLDVTVGTAMNALAHCAEAFYALGRGPRADRHGFTGARAIAYALPLVVEHPRDPYARARLLEGAMRAAQALGAGGLALGHAMAQALGGRYGIAHGAANAVCLAPALRFNAPAVPESVAAFAEAMQADDAPRRVEELARLGGFERLRDLDVPADELDLVAAEAAGRAGARANPRPASAEEVAALYRSVW